MTDPSVGRHGAGTTQVRFVLPYRLRLLNVCRQSLGSQRFDELLDGQHGSRLVIADLAPRLRIARLEFSEPLVASSTLRRALGGDEQEALLPAEQPLYRRGGLPSCCPQTLGPHAVVRAACQSLRQLTWRRAVLGCRRGWSLLFGPVAALRGNVVVLTLNVYGENLDMATGVRVRSMDGRVHAAKIVARPEARALEDYRARANISAP